MKKGKINIMKILALLISVVIIITVIKNTLARYESSAESKGEIGVALYLIKEDYKAVSLQLESLEPRSEPHIYNFTIANNDGTNRTETDLEYTLQIRTTTNLPLTYELYMNQDYNDTNATSIITEDTVERYKVEETDITEDTETETDTTEQTQSEDEAYFRILKTEKCKFVHTEDEINTYQLVIYFPEEYKSVEYQDVIEGIEITVDSKQVI